MAIKATESGNLTVNSKIGVYVPAINKYIALWSIFLKTFLAVSLTIAWYKVEDWNKRNKVAPKIEVDAASTAVEDSTASITIAYIENNAPIACVNAFINSSFGVYFTSSTYQPSYIYVRILYIIILAATYKQYKILFSLISCKIKNFTFI